MHCRELEEYEYPATCPFDVSRAGRVRQLLSLTGLLDAENVRELGAEPADRMALKEFHGARYLHALKSAADGDFKPEAFHMGIGSGDCPVFKDMYAYSAHACGATLKGVELLLSGDADVAFNPSGGLHHAGPERASGFCYLNDVALACGAFAGQGGRVLYLDVDVHHGDGPAYGFYDRADVMTISFHESGRTLFPGTGFVGETGVAEGKGYCVNVPLAAGTYDAAYMKAFESIALPLIGAYAPDVFVFELGADALAGDPLANLQLTNNVYAAVIRHLLTFEKPILMTGGGGYDLRNTVRAWALGWGVLSGTCDGEAAANVAGGQHWAPLLDAPPIVSANQREAVIPAVDAVIEAIKTNLFKLHGL